MNDTFLLTSTETDQILTVLYFVYAAALAFGIVPLFMYKVEGRSVTHTAMVAAFVMSLMIIPVYFLNPSDSELEVEKVSSQIRGEGYTTSINDILDHTTQVEGKPGKIDIDATVDKGDSIPLSKGDRQCEGVPVRVSDDQVNLDVTCE